MSDMKHKPNGELAPQSIQERFETGVALPIATHHTEYLWLDKGEPPPRWKCEYCKKPADTLSCGRYAAHVLEVAPKENPRRRNNADGLGDFTFYNRTRRDRP
jgi:hypothetical protein